MLTRGSQPVPLREAAVGCRSLAGDTSTKQLTAPARHQTEALLRLPQAIPRVAAATDVMGCCIPPRPVRANDDRLRGRHCAVAAAQPMLMSFPSRCAARFAMRSARGKNLCRRHRATSCQHQLPRLWQSGCRWDRQEATNSLTCNLQYHSGKGRSHVGCAGERQGKMRHKENAHGYECTAACANCAGVSTCTTSRVAVRMLMLGNAEASHNMLTNPPPSSQQHGHNARC